MQAVHGRHVRGAQLAVLRIAGKRQGVASFGSRWHALRTIGVNFERSSGNDAGPGTLGVRNNLETLLDIKFNYVACWVVPFGCAE